MRPSASAVAAQRLVLGAAADQAAHQSAQRSSPPVTRSKSATVTPLVVNRGAQCEIAEATLSSIPVLRSWARVDVDCKRVQFCAVRSACQATLHVPKCYCNRVHLSAIVDGTTRRRPL